MRSSSLVSTVLAFNVITVQAYICHLCRDETFPGKPNGGVVILQEVVPLPKPLYTCEELYFLGLEGGIIEKYCLPLVATVKEHCECAEFNTGPPENQWTASTPTGNTWSWNVPWNSWDLPTPSGRVPPSPTPPFDLEVSFPTATPSLPSIPASTFRPTLAPVNPPQAPQLASSNSWGFAWSWPVVSPVSLPVPVNPAPAPVLAPRPTSAPVHPAPVPTPVSDSWKSAWSWQSPITTTAESSPSPPAASPTSSPPAPFSWPAYTSTSWSQPAPVAKTPTFAWPGSGWNPTSAPVVTFPPSESDKQASKKAMMGGMMGALRG